MDVRELYPVLESLHCALTAIFHSNLSTEFSSPEFANNDIDLLLFLPNLDPNPITPELLNSRHQNFSSAYFLSSLNRLCSTELLAQISPEKFEISDFGFKTIHRLEKSSAEVFTGLSPLPVNDLMDLASRLKEIIDGCVSVGTPPGKWCLQIERNHASQAGSPIMYRIYQFLKELTAFRDDAKMSVSNAYYIGGHAWDILTLLWNEQKNQIPFLIAQLKDCGFSAEYTYHTINELTKKGLVLTGIEDVRISPFGAEVRKIAEDTIDRYYYAPWKYFPVQYLEQLLHLLDTCHKNITAMSELPC